MARQFCVKAFILSFCVFFVCTAFAGQQKGQIKKIVPESVKTQSSEKNTGDKGRGSESLADAEYRLRSKPGTFSEDDVRAMLKKYGFYNKRWNSSGDFTNNFTDNGNGTITDSVTGLIWVKAGSFDYMPFSNAQSYIQELNQKKFAGYSDWRLPTLEELASLLENKKVNNIYIDPLFDRRQYWCWTADILTSRTYWLVGFDRGFMDWYRDSSGWVRGVRSRTIDY